MLTEGYDDAEMADVPGADGQAASDTAKTYVTFDLSSQTFGVEVAYVREILDRIEIARLPSATHGVEGVIDVRDQSIPIVDIGSRLGFGHMETGSETRIIVFEVIRNGVAEPVGILADRVRDVTQISYSEIENPPEAVGTVENGGFLSGLARHQGALIALLDIGVILDVS